jgi:folate-binding protein YgfZ
MSALAPDRGPDGPADRDNDSDSDNDRAAGWAAGYDTDWAAGYDALRTSAAVALIPRDVVRVAGPDAETYLQGQCSQDVAALAVGGSLESLLLSPQGKVEIYLRITRETGDQFVLDTDGGFGPAMVTRLERFRLRTKVEFEPLHWACAAVRGPEAADSVVGRPELVLPVSWVGLEGVDLLGPLPPEGVGGWVAGTVVPCPPEAWEAARIEAGMPVNGRELHEGTIAAEVGLVDRTVSFTKGCFTGQELVARLDARGSKVARHLCGVVIADLADTADTADTADAADAADTADTADPADTASQLQAPEAVESLVGSAVFTADGEHEVGHLSSAAWSPRVGGVVALATLHRRVEPPEDVLVAWDRPGRDSRRLPAEALPLPLVGS